MVYVVAVHLSGGQRREHIAEVIWVDSKSFKSGRCTTATMVDFVNKYPGQARVTDGNTTASVEVVNAKPPYLRSEADPSKADNLLSIPRF